MKNNSYHKDWIVYAESDFALAKQGRVSKNILYSSLCFHCQQAVEKSIKAVLIYYNIRFPKTHDIDILIDLLVKNQIETPKPIQESRILTQYAVFSRYPGNDDDITLKDYRSSLKIAETVLKWAKLATTKNKNKLF